MFKPEFANDLLDVALRTWTRRHKLQDRLAISSLVRPEIRGNRFGVPAVIVRAYVVWNSFERHLFPPLDRNPERSRDNAYQGY